MRHIIVLLLAILCYGSLCAQAKATDCTYWVGQSANPDPIMRHHEAFMDAFIKYIRNNPMETAGDVVTDNAEGFKETCRIETVSSVTYEGREVITISIGNGSLVHYQYATVSSSTDDTMQTETILKITYREESDGTDFESVHEYRRECFTEKGGSATEFSYQCIFISKYE